MEQKAAEDAKGGPPANGTATERASPALTNGAYEFEPKRLKPAPQLSPIRRVFKVPVLTRGLPRT